MSACFQVIVFFANRISNKSLIHFLATSMEWQNATERNKKHTGLSFPLTSGVTLKWKILMHYNQTAMIITFYVLQTSCYK